MRALKPTTGAASIMSRALPAARSPATSTITTSARSAWAMNCAAVAPMLPAPTTVTLYRIGMSSVWMVSIGIGFVALEVLEDRAGELRGLEEGRPLRLPLEVVGDPLL